MFCAHIICVFRVVSASQLEASMSGKVLGGVVEDVGSNLASGEIFTAYSGSVDLLFLSVFVCCVNLNRFLIQCSSKAFLFMELYFHSDICLI